MLALDRQTGCWYQGRIGLRIVIGYIQDFVVKVEQHIFIASAHNRGARCPGAQQAI